MTARTIQNFRGFRGVWWGPQGRQSEALRSALARLGMATVSFQETAADGLARERDVLFVDSDFLCDPALAAQPGHLLLPVPVVGVVGVEAPSRLKALSDIGATAFLHKPIHPATVYSSLFLAVNNHARFARLEAQIEEHNRRRAERRYITRAIVALMHQWGMSDEQAYAHLRRESMRCRIGVEDLARGLCESLPSIPTEQEIQDASQDQASGQRGIGGERVAEPRREPGRRSDQARRARGPVR